MTTPLVPLDQLTPITTQRGTDPEHVFAELKNVITDAITNHPRSLQKRIGPSEIGDPCARRIAYKITQTPETRQQPPAWRPTVGTAVHAWLEDAFATYNQDNRDQHGASRFLIEQRINAGPMAGTELEGSTDLYDRVTATSIDWKIVGPSSHRKLSSDVNAGRGPRPTYRVQLHTYGYGFTRRGLPVDTVMLVALPAAGELDDAIVWHEPFNPQVAIDAIARVDRIHAVTQALGPAAYTVTNGQLAAVGAGHLTDPSSGPSGLAIPTDTGGCRFCPWLTTTKTTPASGCPGAAAEGDGADTLRALIA